MYCALAQAQDGDSAAGRGAPKVDLSATNGQRIERLEVRRAELTEQRQRERKGNEVQRVGAGLTVRVKHSLGKPFVLKSVRYLLDGQPLYVVEDLGGKPMADAVLYDAGIVPGQHALSVEHVYEYEPSSFFTYMTGTIFRVRAGRLVDLFEGGKGEVLVDIRDKGTEVGLELNERPEVRFSAKGSAKLSEGR